MIDIILRLNTASEKKLNKVLYLSGGIEYQGVVKGVFDPLDPEIDIDISQPDTLGESVRSFESILSYNYAQITFGDAVRYYYITSMVMLTDSIMRLSLHEDLLMTYREKITDGFAKFLISRTSAGYNQDIRDDRRSFQYTRKTRRVAISTTSSITLHPFTRINDTTVTDRFYRYAWIYATDNTGDVSILSDTAQYYNYPSIISNLIGTSRVIDPTYNSLGGVVLDNPYFAIEQCQKDTAVANATISLVCYPFVIGSSLDSYSVSGIHPYGKDISAPTVGSLSSLSQFISDTNVRRIADFTIDYDLLTESGGYGDKSSWMLNDMDVSIYLPFYGFYKLEPSYFPDGTRIIVFAVINLVMNQGMYIIMDTDNSYYDTVDCTFGTEIPITNTNATDIRDRKVTNTIKTAVGLVGSAIQIGVGTSTGNAWMIAGGATSAVGTIGSAVSNAVTTHEQGSADLQTSSMGTWMSYTPYLKVTYPVPIMDSFVAGAIDTYIKMNGLPFNSYMESVPASNTYVEIADFGDMAQIGTSKENGELRTILKSGIFI